MARVTMQQIEAVVERRRLMDEYLKVSRLSAAYGHSNKCVPIALAVVTGASYIECVSRIDRCCYRRKTKHSGYNEMEYGPVYTAMLKERGLQCVEMDLGYVRTHAKTLATLTPAALAKLGVVDGFVRVKGHIAAIRGGMVTDWSAGRRMPIKKLYKVTKIPTYNTGETK